MHVTGHDPDGWVLKVEDLCVNRAGHRVLDHVDMEVRRGEFLGVTGPNGGGKSTLLQAALGLVASCCGTVTFDLSRGHGGVGYVPQDVSHVDPTFPATAREVVAMGLQGHARWPWQRWGRNHGSAETVDRAMRSVQVDELADRRIGRLSGGQRQRVFLAKALVTEPDLIILDEPTTGVDAAARDRFAHLLLNLNREHGRTIVLVSHDEDILNHVATRILVIDRGLAAEGPADRHGSTLRQLHSMEAR